MCMAYLVLYRPEAFLNTFTSVNSYLGLYRDVEQKLKIMNKMCYAGLSEILGSFIGSLKYFVHIHVDVKSRLLSRRGCCLI